MENDESKIVTLISGDGREVEFREIAPINYNGEYYAIMQPLETLDGDDDINFVLLFKVTKSDNGKAIFEMEQDEEIIEAVFAEFEKLCSEKPE